MHMSCSCTNNRMLKTGSAVRRSGGALPAHIRFLSRMNASAASGFISQGEWSMCVARVPRLLEQPHLCLSVWSAQVSTGFLKMKTTAPGKVKKHYPKFLCCIYIFSLRSYYGWSQVMRIRYQENTVVWHAKILNYKQRHYLRVIVNRFPVS